VVRGERYSPDGSRVDARPVITPNIANANSGLPYPFGNAPAAPANSQPQPGAGAPFKSAPPAAPAAPQQFSAKVAPIRTNARQPAVPAEQPAAGAAGPGFYVSLKSASDEKAIQRELAGLQDKYKSVLGDVQLSSKIADLGAKGVFYRAVAGPLGTRQEALDLCQKIKGVGGDKSCFVTN
jgi:hypothetical protein